MLVQQFLRIPEFEHTPKAEIQALVQRVRVLCLPAQRWLLRDGRKLDAFLYLLHGSIIIDGEHQVASTQGPLHHFYPGGTNIRTGTPTQVLWVDAAQHEFLSRCAQDIHSLNEPSDARWLECFLSSQMMQRVQSDHWQQIVQSFRPRHYRASETVIEKGASGDACFVIQQGHFVVHDGGRTLCHLGPGDFFGEDALVTGSSRNASVTALQPAVVQCIEKHVFSRLLLEQVIEFVAVPEDGRCLNLSDGCQSGEGVALVDLRDHIQCLDGREKYYVSGGTRPQRALAALLLIQQGFTAFPLAQGDSR
jgi:cyclic nucleotide-binding protein